MRTENEIRKGLECCSEIREKCGECPYSGQLRCAMVLKRDALELFKKRDLKPVGKFDDCPRCGTVLSRYNNIHFCGKCGQGVQWNEVD